MSWSDICVTSAVIFVSQSKTLPITGRGTKRNNRDGERHGGPLGALVRHDHHQQRHATRVPTAPERDQQSGTRAAVGPSSLVETHLAPGELRCSCSLSCPDVPSRVKTKPHYIRVRYAQTHFPYRGSNASGFTFVRLSQTLDFEKIQVRT